MSVTLVPLAADAWAPTPNERSSIAALAASRATTFVRAQAQWLRRGLLHTDDQVAVDIVLAAHDRSHERWLCAVAAVNDAVGQEATDRIAALYGYCGQVAGALAAGAITLLRPDVAAQARQLAADRLVEVTEGTVEALWAAAAQA